MNCGVRQAYAPGTDTLTVTSDGAADTMVIACQTNALLVNGAPPTSGVLACTAPSTVLVYGNGGNDTLDVKGLEGLPLGAVTADGGDGDDQVTGVYLASNGQVVTLAGGPGADTLTSNTSDILQGGPGDDRLVGPAQDGGTLDGEDGPDTLIGGEGNDFLDGVGGADSLLAGGGLDLVHARDGVADSGDCGTEDDTLVADAIDAFVGCERVDLPVVAAPPDTVAPALGVSRARPAKRKLRMRVACPAGELRCAGILTLLGVGRRAGGTARVRLGPVTLQLAGGEAKTLTRRIPRKRVRALNCHPRRVAAVLLDVVDGAGNRKVGTTRIRLRR